MNLGMTGIVRRDLGFGLGLMSAQVAHIMMETIRQGILTNELSVEQKEWLKKPYMYVYEVYNRESLELLIEKADSLGIEVWKWKDTVRIDIGGENRSVGDVLVGVSFGVNDSDRIKPLVGNLPMLGKTERI